jgi:outer membrane receptor protein involved in Fe transport
MVKKFFYVLMALLFICAFTITTTPVYAQEEEEEVVEDVADISLEDLLNVEITTAGKRAEKIGDIPASVIIVTREDIETHGYQNLAEILQNIQGLYYVNDYSYDSFGVRGFWTDSPQRNQIVLVDDVKQVDGIFSAHFLEQISVPIEAIDRIEVVRGPMSVLYGSGAFFGVINIKTRLEGTEPVSMVNASAGSEKTYKLFARASGKQGDFHYAFNGSYFDTEGLDVPLDEIAGPTYAGVTTKGQLENTVKYFNFSGKLNWFYFNAQYVESYKENAFLLPSVSEGTATTDRGTRLLFGIDKEFSDKVRLDAKMGYSFLRTFVSYDLLMPDLFAEQNTGNTSYSVEVNLFINPTPNFNLTLGLSYVRIFDILDSTDFPLLGINNSYGELAEGEAIETLSAYTQLDLKLTDKVKLVAGARVEKMPEYILQSRTGISDPTDPLFGTETISQVTYSKPDPQFIPRAALIFSPNDKNSIKLLYGKAINHPSFFQNLDLFNPLSIPLNPENISTFELNYIGILSKKFTLSLSLFYNMLDQLIYRTQIYVGGEYVTYVANVGQMNTTGMEMSIKISPSESFSLELAGTLQETKDKREGLEDIEPGYSPKLLGYIKASYFINKDISLAVTGNYVGEMESFWDVTLQNPDGTFGQRLGEKVDGYFLLGANLRIRNLFGTGMFLNIRGSNLLDQKYHFPATSNNNLFATYGTLGRGMSIFATLGIKFIPQPMPLP